MTFIYIIGWPEELHTDFYTFMEENRTTREQAITSFQNNQNITIALEIRDNTYRGISINNKDVYFDKSANDYFLKIENAVKSLLGDF